MTYINEVIKESLRLTDPAAGIAPRLVTEDTVLSETFVPKGSFVSVNIFNIHHREKYWKNTTEFDPDRFAEDGEGNTRKSGENMARLPFSNGARQCLGMNFSLVEQRVILSLLCKLLGLFSVSDYINDLLFLVRKFTWSLSEDSKHKDGLITGGFPIVCPLDLELSFHKRY
jgi:cytochrome P450